MTHGSKALVLTLLVSLTGCPAEEDGEMNDTPGGQDGATAEGTTTEDPEETQGTDDSTGEPPVEPVVEACGLATPCSQYLFACNPINSDDCATVPYPEGLVCALETLAAGEQAELHANFNGTVTGEVEWLDIAVYGPEAALYQYTFQSWDSAVDVEPARRCSPKPAAWFEACLADAGDDAQHIACMNPYEWFEGCTEATQCL